MKSQDKLTCDSFFLFKTHICIQTCNQKHLIQSDQIGSNKLDLVSETKTFQETVHSNLKTHLLILKSFQTFMSVFLWCNCVMNLDGSFLVYKKMETPQKVSHVSHTHSESSEVIHWLQLFTENLDIRHYEFINSSLQHVTLSEWIIFLKSNILSESFGRVLSDLFINTMIQFECSALTHLLKGNIVTWNLVYFSPKAIVWIQKALNIAL